MVFNQSGHKPWWSSYSVPGNFVLKFAHFICMEEILSTLGE